MSLNYNLDQWLEFIDKLDINNIELGLERVSAVYNCCIDARKKADLPFTPPKVISIAGTNGKGSCVAVLEQIMLKAGKLTGAYTSPHLIRFTERIRINGDDVNEQALCAAFDEVERVRELANIKLTYFEYTTLAAFVLMLDAKLDYWILEVGLGGRLDAVNSIDADVAIITSIALDHTQFLGDTIAQIAFEKSGITRRDKPVVCGTDLPELLATLEQDYQVKPLVYNRDFDCQYDTQHIVKSNAACALQAAKLLGINVDYSPSQWHQLINDLNLLCRLQLIEHKGLNILLDVAHNEAAAQRLQQYLEASNYRNICVAFGMMADKDILSVVSALSNSVEQWILCDIPQQQRAATAKQIQTLLKPKYPQLNIQIADDVQAAIEQYRLQLATSSDPTFSNTVLSSTINTTSNKTDSILIVTGSFYTTGSALQWLTTANV